MGGDSIGVEYWDSQRATDISKQGNGYYGAPGLCMQVSPRLSTRHRATSLTEDFHQDGRGNELRPRKPYGPRHARDPGIVDGYKTPTKNAPTAGLSSTPPTDA
ncbi:hypothetical protein PC117_g1892 [Phytophthora cactorum]|uniref:Uncharacterized protein n=1 Tax=Phytophthora cactorum TaxID=29920 RepID=A0A8T1EFE2_9STRA|nr:hypothetical protein PC117_g1892 [Phytophthora cactorum]